MEETYDIKKAIICLVILIIIIGIFYGITMLVISNKEAEEEKENNYTSIQYEEIIVSNILKQTDSDYYVLVTTSYSTDYKQYISDFATYTTKQGALPTYRVDLDNSFNKNYYQEESDFTGEIPVFKGSTLLRIVDHKITEIYEESEIKDAISYLVNGV